MEVAHASHPGNSRRLRSVLYFIFALKLKRPALYENWPSCHSAARASPSISSIHVRRRPQTRMKIFTSHVTGLDVVLYVTYTVTSVCGLLLVKWYLPTAIQVFQAGSLFRVRLRLPDLVRPCILRVS